MKKKTFTKESPPREALITNKENIKAPEVSIYHDRRMNGDELRFSKETVELEDGRYLIFYDFSSQTKPVVSNEQKEADIPGRKKEE